MFFLGCALGGPFQSLRVRSERSEHDVDVSGPERLLPMFGAALVRVTQNSGASSHALLKLRRKAIERCLRHTKCLEPLKAECDAHPGVARLALRMCSRCHHGAYSAHQFPPGL